MIAAAERSVGQLCGAKRTFSDRSDFRVWTPERKFEFRTPLAIGTFAVSGTTGRRAGGKCGTLRGSFSG
jgi:hypothetical protein